MTAEKRNAPSGARRGPAPRPAGSRPVSSWNDPNRPRIDRSILWAVFLFLLNFPGILLFLAIVGAFALEAGIDLGSNDSRLGILNALYIAAVLAVWLTAAMLGIRGWRRSGQRLGLVVAALSVLAGAAFVALPYLA